MTVPELARRPGSLRLRGVVGSAVLSPVLVAVLVGVLAGCASAEVTIEPRDVSSADTAACRALLDDLPDVLADEQRRPVDPDEALGAAWGDPAVVLECGTTMPASFDDFSQCSLSDDVQWYIPDDELKDPTADITIWSLGYEPVISVLVPASYRPVADAVMGDLREAINADLTLVHPCV